MDVLFQEMIDRFTAIHGTIEKAISELPAEALDWSPGPDMNSIGVLVTHALGATRFWVGDVAGGDPSGRVRETEFQTTGVTAAEYIARSHECLAHSQAVLSRLSPAELNDIRIVPNSNREVTVVWAILHALEHAALHAGHIEITRQIWAQRVGKGYEIS
jgi:uncharacterized damage-inducible protein DinB